MAQSTGSRDNWPKNCPWPKIWTSVQLFLTQRKEQYSDWGFTVIMHTSTCQRNGFRKLKHGRLLRLSSSDPVLSAALLLTASSAPARSGRPLVVRTERLPFLRELPHRHRLASHPCVPEFDTIKRVIHCAACTRKFNARSPRKTGLTDVGKNSGLHADIHQRKKWPRIARGCHSVLGWNNAVQQVRINQNRFPLLGAHAAVQCEECLRRCGWTVPGSLNGLALLAT